MLSIPSMDTIIRLMSPKCFHLSSINNFGTGMEVPSFLWIYSRHSFLGYFMNLFTPTALLAVDSTLNLPKDFHLLNHTPFSDYDYYPQEIAKKESERSQFETNILNFTKKNYIPVSILPWGLSVRQFNKSQKRRRKKRKRRPPAVSIVLF